MSAADSTTSIYIGNLKQGVRLLELKASLLKLLHKTLKVHITNNDISIINGPKRYALVDVHNEQNVDFLLQNIADYEDRKKIKFDFSLLVDKETFLYVDKVKSQDEKQARDDFENAKNPKPFQKPHLHVRKRPEYDVIIPLKKKSSDSHSSRGGSRLSTSTRLSHNSVDANRSTDLEVSISDQRDTPTKGAGDDIPEHFNMIPLADSTLKEESDDSGTQMDAIHNHTISSIHGEADDSPPPSDYEDPPGSVIDLRHVSRPSLQQGKITPRIHRRTTKKTRNSKSSASRRDFFAFLDQQIDGGSPDEAEQPNQSNVDNDQVTPYYRPGEMIYNNDLSKEFKSYLEGKYTLKQIRDHVSRCVCAFLNAGQRGMLLIGVDSRGMVIGIDCKHQQEDRYRRHFLDAIKDIYPPVFGDEYSIHFAPLLEDNGRQHPSLKVIEIRVFPPDNPDVLYECKEGVFVRRNGVLTGPIRPSHIQEWIRQKHYDEMNEMRTSETYLKEELIKKDEMLRRQADTILSQKSEIEHQRTVIESKGCNIL